MNWLHWSESSFARAKKSKKPILLCISASWCHWCHTMDKLVYADKKIAAFIKKHVVPIRVDLDHRPDINTRYNVGGTPTTLILAHDGEPVAAATYIPRERMLSFLQDGLSRFSRHKGVKPPLPATNQVQTSADSLYAQLRGLYDSVNGGFGLEPKLPNPEILEYLVYRCELRRDQDALKMLDHALMAMVTGEIFDHVQGGFFRQAALQNWTILSFEKMLELNAKLLSIYIRGFELIGRKEYLLAANKTLSFMFTVLYDEKVGLFYGSQDADESFCHLPLHERLAGKHAFVDKNFYTTGNALAALALFEAGRLELEYQDAAVRVVDQMLKLSKGEVGHKIPSEWVCTLRDIVFMLMAVAGASMVTKNKRFVTETKRLVKLLFTFEDKKNGGFQDIIVGKKAFGRLQVSRKPVYENACAALVLRALAGMRGEKKYVESAVRALKAVSAQAAAQGGYAATYALALEEFGGSIH